MTILFKENCYILTAKGEKTMRKAAHVLYIIGAIFAILGFIGMLILGFTLQNAGAQAIEEAWKQSGQSMTLEQFTLYVKYAATTMISLGFVSLGQGIFSFIGASFVSKGSGAKWIHIVNLILSIACFQPLTLIASIFGLVAPAEAKEAK